MNRLLSNDFMYGSTFDCVTAGLDAYSAWMIALVGSYTLPGFDILMSQFVSFSLFWMCGVAMSLFSRASHVDGSGIHFNTEVFC